MVSPVFFCVLCGRELKPEPQGTQRYTGERYCGVKLKNQKAAFPPPLALGTEN